MRAMTMGNAATESISQTPAAGWPRRPRRLAQSLAAAIVTAFAAGPITFIFGMAILMANDPMPRTLSADFGDLIEGIANTSMAGLVGSVPAAIINTLTLGWLATHGRDSLGLAIASGLALGALIGVTACILVASIGETDSTFTIEKLIPTLPISLAFIAAGGLMGALHWRIAIRPQRRWRLYQEQERIALRAME
jgi:hypothetical protein